VKGIQELVAEGTIRNTLSTVAKMFLENNKPNPQLSTDGKTAISIRRILQGFKATTNGNEVRKKAIPVSVICQVYKLYS
jgi:hypothetical protein